MKISRKKILLPLFVVLFNLFNAQSNGPGCNPFTGCKPASPVDMYVYVLAIVAILMIAFFAKKYKTQKI